MPLPTLLVEGNLIPNNPFAVNAGNSVEKPIRPIDAITGWVRARDPATGGSIPKSMADRVLVVRAKTSSGKSTVMPAFLWDLLPTASTAGVICTQPRILTAIEISRNMAESEFYPKLIAGETVGYRTGPLSDAPSVGGLVYATAPLLARELAVIPVAELVNKYKVIIVDEVHERDLGTDILIAKLRESLQTLIDRGLDAPFVLLASATIDVDLYADYFGVGAENIADVEGRPFEVEQRFLPQGSNMAVAEAAALALALAADQPPLIGDSDSKPDPLPGDILVFLPGNPEIKLFGGHLCRVGRKRARALAKAGAEPDPPVALIRATGDDVRNFTPDFIKLTADLTDLRVFTLCRQAKERKGKIEDAYEQAKEKPEPGDEEDLVSAEMVVPSRKIIAASAVAETGLTLPGLSYVIDLGFARNMEFYWPGGYRGLITRPAPKPRGTQRWGRAGRVQAGVAYPLYTAGVDAALPDAQPPNVVTQDFGAGILAVAEAMTARNPPTSDSNAVFSLGDGYDMGLLDGPPPDALAAAIESSLLGGFIAQEAGAGSSGTGPSDTALALTPLGLFAARLGTSYSLAALRAITGCCLFGVPIADAVTLAAVISPEAPFPIQLIKQNPRADFKPFIREALSAIAPGWLGDRKSAGDRLALLLAGDALVQIAAFSKFAMFAAGGTSSLAGGSSPAALAEFAKAHRLNLDNLLDFTEAREGMLNDLAGFGVDASMPGRRMALADALKVADPRRGFRELCSSITGLKRLVAYALAPETTLRHEGGRFPSYKDRLGKQFDLGGKQKKTVPPILTTLREIGVRRHPQTLVASRFTLAADAEYTFYRLSVGCVEVLDGFVELDPEFEQPRNVADDGVEFDPAPGSSQAAADAYQKVLDTAMGKSKKSLISHLSDETYARLFPVQLRASLGMSG